MAAAAGLERANAGELEPLQPSGRQASRRQQRAQPCDTGLFQQTPKSALKKLGGDPTQGRCSQHTTAAERLLCGA